MVLGLISISVLCLFSFWNVLLIWLRKQFYQGYWEGDALFIITHWDVRTERVSWRNEQTDIFHEPFWWSEKKYISELSLWYLRLSLPKCDISLICISCQISVKLKITRLFPGDLVTVTWLYNHREIPLRKLTGRLTFSWTADVGWDSIYNFRK